LIQWQNINTRKVSVLTIADFIEVKRKSKNFPSLAASIEYFAK
jgi:hypothetical protein